MNLFAIAPVNPESWKNGSSLFTSSSIQPQAMLKQTAKIVGKYRRANDCKAENRPSVSETVMAPSLADL